MRVAWSCQVTYGLVMFDKTHSAFTHTHAVPVPGLMRCSLLSHLSGMIYISCFASPAAVWDGGLYAKGRLAGVSQHCYELQEYYFPRKIS